MLIKVGQNKLWRVMNNSPVPFSKATLKQGQPKMFSLLESSPSKRELLSSEEAAGEILTQQTNQSN